MLLALALALFLGFALGLAFDHRVASFLRQRWAARPEPQGSLRHTIDHRCQPPSGSWSAFDDDVCFVEIGAYGQKIQPGDVWVCACLRSWIAENGQWRPQPRALEEGAA
jgi:hypothetical protein